MDLLKPVVQSQWYRHLHALSFGRPSSCNDAFNTRGVMEQDNLKMDAKAPSARITDVGVASLRK